MWKHIWSNGTWKKKTLVPNMDPDVSHGAKHKWQVEWNHRNWKTQHQTRIKIIHHLQHQLPFYTRQLMNVKRKITREHIKIQAGAGSARFVLFFPQPFPVSQSLPCSFNLASTHTHSPQLSPLHYFSANQRIRVMQGAPVNQRRGLLKRLQTHREMHVHRETSSQSFKHTLIQNTGHRHRLLS